MSALRRLGVVEAEGRIIDHACRALVWMSVFLPRSPGKVSVPGKAIKVRRN
jgi:hypothetical protein